MSAATRPLAGRVALVTGAGSGIGRAVALRLAGAGASVALGYSADARSAEDLATRIATDGRAAIAIGADLRRTEAPHELFDAAEDALGPVDVLVNSAGIARVQALEGISSEEFDETVAVNLRAPFLLSQRAVPAMGERGFGRVLFVSSVAALTGGIVGPHYAASKSGLHGLTHFLTTRFASSGVTVNAIAPARITDTKMLPGDPAELRKRVPVGRLGQPDEVGDLALAVLTNPYVTNQVISIDGGTYAR